MRLSQRRKRVGNEKPVVSIEDLKIGDLVILRSGGPIMTISQQPEDDIVEVNWFGGDELKRDGFHKSELLKTGR